MKNKSLKAEMFGFFLIVLTIVIYIFGNERIIEFTDIITIFLISMATLGIILIVFKKQLQKHMNKHSHDEWALYLFVFTALAFILDYATTTYNIPFILTLIAYIPLGIGIGYILRKMLKIK